MFHRWLAASWCFKFYSIALLAIVVTAILVVQYHNHYNNWWCHWRHQNFQNMLSCNIVIAYIYISLIIHRGQTDVIRLRTSFCVGQLSQIRLHRGESGTLPNWHLDTVQVDDTHQRTTYDCVFKSWIPPRQTTTKSCTIRPKQGRLIQK